MGFKITANAKTLVLVQGFNTGLQGERESQLKLQKEG